MALKPITIPGFYTSGALRPIVGGLTLYPTAQPVVGGGLYNAAVVTDSAPSNLAPPVIASSSTPAAPESTLSITSFGSWSGHPSPTLDHVEWLKNGVVIAGEVGNSYVPQAGDIGATISAKVYFSNTLGTASAESNGIAIAAGTTFATHVTSISGWSAVGGTITLNGTNAQVDTPLTVTQIVLGSSGICTGAAILSILPSLENANVDGLAITSVTLPSPSVLDTLAITNCPNVAFPDLSDQDALVNLQIQNCTGVGTSPPDLSGCTSLSAAALIQLPITSAPSFTGLPMTVINLSGCPITAGPTVTGLTSLVSVNLNGCSITNPTNLDNFLVALDTLVDSGGGSDNGTCDVRNTSTPTATGIAAIDDLVNNHGWTVLYDAPSGFTYLRPGGVSTYFRPDGVSIYLQP